jgi:hypothetical protein
LGWSGSGYGHVSWCCKCVDELHGSMKYEEIFE